MNKTDLSVVNSDLTHTALSVTAAPPAGELSSHCDVLNKNIQFYFSLPNTESEDS